MTSLRFHALRWLHGVAVRWRMPGLEIVTRHRLEGLR